VSLNTEDASKNKPAKKSTEKPAKPNANEGSSDEHNVILNNLANEVMCNRSYVRVCQESNVSNQINRQLQAGFIANSYLTAYALNFCK
jgi:hypothetical protein